MSRVLSIQSHVVHGYVGNKSAVFPLQLLGYDVDFVNSVHFSNHTGYENGLKGEVMNGDQLLQILHGLQDNHLLGDVGNVLTGYMGSLSFCEAVMNVVQTIRKVNPNLRFVCDPVLGDHGRFYVPESLVSVFREKVLPLADVTTPNQFEVEQLTGISIQTMEDARKACDALHRLGPSTVFITSVEFPADAKDSSASEPTISIIASQRSKDRSTPDEIWCIDCPMIPGAYTGTGDLTAALLLGHLAKTPNDLPRVMECVTNTMYVVIQRTHESAGSTAQSKELKLIQSKADIENPPDRFRARRVE
eukprot:Nitzschia sp. Nitz4//scaffold2_size372955//26510//27507//NITZ4_000358-RA/size372955-processed-gene-0.387-mRNA-1//1//CDS//3329546581//6990//frame0